MRLRWHLLLLILLAALPTLALQIVYEYRQRDARRAEIADEVRAHAQAVAVHVDELFDRTAAVLATAAHIPAVRERAAEACSAVLAAVRPVAGADIVGFGPEGRAFCATRPIHLALDVADRAYFQRVMGERTLTVGNYVIDPTSGEGLVPVAQPVLDEQGAVAAVVAMGITAGRLSTALDRLDLPPGGVLGIMQRDGTLLAHVPAAPEQIGQPFPDAEFRTAAAAGISGTFKAGLDGAQRFAGLAPLSGAPHLIAYYGVPAATAFAEAERLFKQELGLTIMAFVLAALAALVGGDLFVRRPVTALRDKVGRLATGEMIAASGTVRRGLAELRELDQSIDATAHLLNQRQEALQARTAELETVMETVPAIIWLAHDPEAKRITGSRYAAERLQLAPAENQSRSAPDGTAPVHFRVLQDGVEVAPDQLPMQRAARGEDVYGEELQVLFEDGSFFWELVNAAPVRDESGRVTGAVGAAVDITERKKAEFEREELLENQRLLMAELDHRVKNTLATVQSVVLQTLRPSAEAEALTGRLAALAKAHGLLAQSRWRGARLRALLQEELQPYRKHAGESRVRLAGPDLLLPPKMAQSLGLVVHELTTNAAKYGALSVPTGRIEVSWDVQRDGAARLRLVWRELGGPRIDGPPGRSGFGSRLIERSLAYDLDGEAEIEFRPEGLHCRIEMPLDPTVLSPTAPPVGTAAEDGTEPAETGRPAGRSASAVTRS